MRAIISTRRERGGRGGGGMPISDRVLSLAGRIFFRKNLRRFAEGRESRDDAIDDKRDAIPLWAFSAAPPFPVRRFESSALRKRDKAAI